MVKNSVLLVSVLSLGLMFTSHVEAAKRKEAVIGPMDSFVTRTAAPKLITSKVQKRKHTKRAPAPKLYKKETLYFGIAGPEDEHYPLDQMQRAWLLKNS